MKEENFTLPSDLAKTETYDKGNWWHKLAVDQLTDKEKNEYYMVAIVIIDSELEI